MTATYDFTGLDAILGNGAWTGPDVIQGYGAGVNPDGTWAKPAAADDTPASTAQDDYWKAKAKAESDYADAQKNQLIATARNYFQQNGMGDFIAAMEKYVTAGYEGDSIMVMIHNDPAYKAAWDKRFAGNATRIKNGLSELLPAEYVSLEQTYKGLLLQYGAPTTLFDDPTDFADLIGKDVSATEMNDRLTKASDYINYEGNADVKQQLRDIYDMTDNEMFAYVLDQTKTADYLNSESRRNLNRANVGGAAATQGVQLTTDFRDEIAGMYTSVNSPYTSTFSDSSAKFGTVAQQQPLYKRLGQLSSVAATSNELVREQFGLAGGADVTNKKKGLASQERARFAGQSGLSATALSAGRKAQ